MKFKINNDEWEIVEKPKQEMIDTYNKETGEDTSYVFGYCQKSSHTIAINRDLCIDQKRKTLKHELTHCYIWEHGLYNADIINEEMVCDIVACSNDFINEVVKEYFAIERRISE